MSAPSLKRSLALIRVKDTEVARLFSDVLMGNQSFSLDMTKSVTHSSEVSITDFPTYSGIVKIDQVIQRPGVFTLQGFIGNHQYGAYRKPVNIDRVRALLDHLRSKAYLLTIYTEDATYDNYIIRSMNIGKPNPETIDVNLQLREVFMFKESLVRVAISDSGQVIGGGNPFTAENVAALVEALIPKIQSKLDLIVAGSNLKASMAEQLNVIMALGASYGLVSVTELGSNVVDVGPPATGHENYNDFFARPWEDRLVFKYRYTEYPDDGGDAISHYQLRVFFWEPWSFGDWDSEIQGTKVKGFQFKVSPLEVYGFKTTPFSERDTLEELSRSLGTESDMITFLKLARVNNWKFRCEVKDLSTNRNKNVTAAIREGLEVYEQISEASARAFLVPVDDKDGVTTWGFRTNLLGKDSPYGWLYQTAFTSYGEGTTLPSLLARKLKLNFVYMHPDFAKAIKTTIEENWKPQWGELE